MGPKAAHSMILSAEEEAIVVAFRTHTLLPLDDCLYALQATVPRLTRSSLHRCLKRHGISPLPEIADDKGKRKPFRRYPIGYFHIDIAEVRTGEGKLYPFVAIDRTSKFAVARLHAAANVKIAAYNFAKRLKTLRGLTSYEAICKAWADQPDRFRYDPTHLTSGLNT
jgi:hypothetical protein